MPQSYKTAIAFGLVYVPVTLHACIKNNDVSFNQLYKKTMERIRYKKTCDNCPPNVSEEDIVKGFQYEKGKYVVLNDAEIEKIKSKKDKAVVITEFVKLNEIDPIYFEKSYYVQPTSAENAFQLIVDAMEQENKVGIAKTVLGTKEQLVAVGAHDGQMLLHTMHFADEVQPPPSRKEKPQVNAKELSLAKTVIANMTAKFEAKNFKDDYRERLLKAIEAKIEGREIREERSVKIVSIGNLMDALKKSVEQTSAKPKTAASKTTAGKRSEQNLKNAIKAKTSAAKEKSSSKSDVAEKEAAKAKTAAKKRGKNLIPNIGEKRGGASMPPVH